MISAHYPNPHKTEAERTLPVIYSASGAVIPVFARAQKMGITAEEWLRRDKVVKELERTFPFKVGQTCWPRDPAGQEKYGECRITWVSRGYDDLENEKWPVNDNPFIVTCRPVDSKKNKGEVYICTTNYLQGTKDE